MSDAVEDQGEPTDREQPEEAVTIDPGEPDDDAIALRALQLSWLPNAGSDDDNWERARLELLQERTLIAKRAAEIARSEAAASDTENWLLAEKELDMSLRQRRAYRTKLAYWEGGMRHEAMLRERISARTARVGGSSDPLNETQIRQRAERLVREEFGLISARCHVQWAGTPRWLDAERELIAEGVLPLEMAD